MSRTGMSAGPAGLDDPSKKWICGRRAMGEPCPLGPSRYGFCGGTRECVPAKLGGRWQCRRPHSKGGPCAEGPSWWGKCGQKVPPCRPTRTLRAQRESVARWAALLTVGLTALMFAYATNTQFLMPGPLASAHSSLEACSTCHTNVSDKTFGWLYAVFAKAVPEKDSKACVTCHKMGDVAFNPHGAERDTLQALTRKMEEYLAGKSMPAVAALRNAVFSVPSAHNDNVYCATCHKDHKGRDFDLKEMSNDRCQSCHTVQFGSFHNSHPNFGDYPFSRRSRIFFDHTAHFGKNFAEWSKKNPNSDAVPATCADCHILSADNKHMAVKSFDQTCSTCHLGQIVGAERAQGPKGIAFFTLPGLDVETLKQKKINVGAWPEESEGELTPFMKLLIGRNESKRAMLDRIEALDLLDLSGASKQELSAVREFAWEVKFLLHGMSKLKPSVIMERVVGATGAKLSSETVRQLNASLPRDVLAKAQRSWVPNLAKEVETNNRKKWLAWLSYDVPGDESLVIAPPVKRIIPPKAIETEKAQPTAELIAPQIEPAPQPAQPVAKVPVKESAPSPATEKSAPVLKEEKAPASAPATQPSGPQTDDLLIDEKDIPKAGRSGSVDPRILRKPGAIFEYLEDRTVPSAGRGSFDVAQRLRINEFGEIVEDDDNEKPESVEQPAPTTTKPETRKPSPPVAPAKPATSGSSPKRAPVAPPPTVKRTKPGGTPAPAPKRRAAPTPPAAPTTVTKEKPKKASAKPARKVRELPRLTGENWAEFGGWYVQDYSIFYKPSGHRDSFVEAWLNLTGKVFIGSDTDAATHVFEVLSGKDAQGQCTKCHSVDATKAGRRTVNWLPSALETRTSQFTRFGHGPHMSLMDKDLCLTCHAQSDAKGQDKTYEGVDPFVAVSNFKSVDQKKCAECHKPQQARSDCLLCHKYHVNEIKTPSALTKIPK